MEEIGKYADRVIVINQKIEFDGNAEAWHFLSSSEGAGMSEFLSALSQPFMTRALIVGTVISICAALLGVILVLKRYALIGHGLADIGFASLSPFCHSLLDGRPIYASMPIVAAASFCHYAP